MGDQPVAPQEQPVVGQEQPVTPNAPQGETSTSLFDVFGTPSGSTNGSTAKNDAPPATDLSSQMAQSSGNTSVEVQERSSVSFDPHIRGYKWGQIYADADGAYWTPARLDMDTMLSKIDPSMIQSVEVIPGPYGVRYGPGLAFIDVNRSPTRAAIASSRNSTRSSTSAATAAR